MAFPIDSYYNAAELNQSSDELHCLPIESFHFKCSFGALFLWSLRFFLVKILFVEILLLKIISVEDLKFFSGLLGSNGNFLTLSMKSFRRCSSRTFLSIRCLDSAANQEITAE